MNRESRHTNAVSRSRDGPTGPSPVPGAPRGQQLLDTVPPASWAVVMGSGIVSIDLYSDHRPVLSAIMLWFAAGAWLLLAVVLGARLAYQPGVDLDRIHRQPARARRAAPSRLAGAA